MHSKALHHGDSVTFHFYGRRKVGTVSRIYKDGTVSVKTLDTFGMNIWLRGEQREFQKKEETR